MLPDDTPKLEPVVQKSSSPVLVPPEASVDRLEANAHVPEHASAVQLEPSFPAPLTTPITLPLTVANTTERPSASASCPVPMVGEHKPQIPNTDKPLLDPPRTLTPSPVPVPKTLNGLADPAAELDMPAHDSVLLTSVVLQPQLSAPVYREAPSETLPPDVRPEVPIAAALTPLMAPVSVVPVTLTSSPAPALPIMLPPGLPPLVQATTEADEHNKPTDNKDISPRSGTEDRSTLFLMNAIL